jgi:chromosome segregation ATPase
MAGDVRGHDLDSWRRNRAAYRDEVIQAVKQWQAAANRYLSAAGKTPAAAQQAPAGENLESLTQAGEAAMASIQSLRNQNAALDLDREQAHSNYVWQQEAIQAACAKRVQGERQEAYRKAYQSKVQMEKGKGAFRKFASLAVLVVTLYLLIKF